MKWDITILLHSADDKHTGHPSHACLKGEQQQEANRNIEHRNSRRAGINVDNLNDSLDISTLRK